VSFTFSGSFVFNCGLVSVVGIAISCRLDCLEFERRWKWDFQHPSRMSAKNIQRPVRWTPDFIPESKPGGAWRKPRTPVYRRFQRKL